LVDDTRPVELRGVDVVDPAVYRRPQYTHGLVTVARRPEDVVAGQLHGAVPEPVDPPSTDSE
jgi:hypothetical protein